MVRDALRTYLSLAGGLVDVPRQQAVRAARALVSQGEATAEQAGSIAEDLLGTSRANRDALRQLIRYEVDRGLGRLGLATSEDVRDLTNRVHQLEAELRTLRGAGATAGSPSRPDKPAVGSGTVGKKAAAGTVSTSAATRATRKAAKKPGSKAAPAKKASGSKASPAKKPGSQAAPARKTAKKTASAGLPGRPGLTRTVPAGDRRGEDAK